MSTRPYPSFLIYLDKADEFRWRYQAAGNHETLADSGESFTTYRACMDNIKMIQASASSAIWQTDKAATKKKKTG
jgi:uncharacterized protein